MGVECTKKSRSQLHLIADTLGRMTERLVNRIGRMLTVFDQLKSRPKKKENQFIRALIDNDVECWADLIELDDERKSEIEALVPSGIELRTFISTSDELKDYLNKLERTEEYEKFALNLRVLNIKEDLDP